MQDAAAVNRRDLLAAGFGMAAAACAGEADRPGRNGRIRQSLAYWCLSATGWAWDLDRICGFAKELGCESVELVPPEQWDTLAKYGLRSAIAPNGMPDPPFVKGANNPRYQDEVIERTRKAIDQCAAFGVPNVIAFTGFKQRDVDDPSSEEISLEEGAENCVKALKAMAEHAERQGVSVCLEQLNTRDDSHPMKGHPGYQGDDIDYCAEIVRRVGSPNVKLLFDIYHVQIMNGDVIRRLREYRELLGHIHVAGNPGRAEPDGSQEIGYQAIMRALLEMGYEGYVGQEFIPTIEPTESVAAAVRLCDV